MLKLLAVYSNLYAVYDDTDNTTDLVSKDDLQLLLNFGVSVDNVTRLNGDEFSVSDAVAQPSNLEVETADEADEYEDWDGYDIAEEPEESFEDELEDFTYDEDESAVRRLYGYLTDEQIQILCKYYLWYSRKIFEESGRSHNFSMKSSMAYAKKKAAIDEIKAKNPNAMWVYAGFYYTLHSDYCNFGHKINNVHVAWDASMGDVDTVFFGEDYSKNYQHALEMGYSIKFGVKCVLDFFDIDADTCKELQRAQRECLSDMKVLLSYYDNNLQGSLIKEFDELNKVMTKYKSVWMMMRLAGKDMKLECETALIQFYLDFKNANMIPPKSMVQLIRDRLVGWGNHKFSGHLGVAERRILNSTVSKLWGTDIGNIFAEFDNQYVKTCLNEYLCYRICGTYRWGFKRYDTDNENSIWKDEGGASKAVVCEKKAINSTLDKYFGVTTDTINFEMFPKLYEFCLKVRETLGVLRALRTTVSGIEKSFDDIGITKSLSFKEKINSPYLPDKLYSRYLGRFIDMTEEELFNYLIKGYLHPELLDQFKDGVVRWEHEYLVPKYATLLEQEKARQAEEVRLKEEARLQQEKEREQRELELAEQAKAKAEIEQEKQAKSVEYKKVLDYLETADIESLRGNSDFAFPIKLLDAYKATHKEQSDKQMFYINKLYAHLTGNAVAVAPVERVKVSDKPALAEAMQWYIDECKDTDERTKSICSSMLKYGTISEKQMKYAVSVKELYDKSKV